MSIDYTILKNEILTDPSGLGYSTYVNIGSDNGVRDLLNQPNNNYTIINPEITLQNMLIWGATGPFNSIKNYADNTSGNSAIRSICLAALNMFNAGVPVFHMNDKRLNDPNGIGLLQILENGGIVSSDDLFTLNSYTVVSGVNRASTLFGLNTVLSSNDISKALRGQ